MIGLCKYCGVNDNCPLGSKLSRWRFVSGAQIVRCVYFQQTSLTTDVVYYDKSVLVLGINYSDKHKRILKDLKFIQNKI